MWHKWRILKLSSLLFRGVKAIFLAAIFVFAVLEIALFLSGQYLLWQRRIGENRPGQIRIVCLGDSHTFGVGTSMQYSYPKQLERLLDINNSGRGFSVVNLGIPGAGLKRQSRELESFFNGDNAELVILLTGRNNDFDIKKWKAVPLKSFKFLREIIFHAIGKQERQTDSVTPAYQKRYAQYLNLYLERIRKLCRDRHAVLVLLSYYNSSDAAIKEFAKRHRTPYFDFTEDFKSLFATEERANYVCLDKSHLNNRGYKFFAERLYEYLFLNQWYLGLKLSPLLKPIKENEFYANAKEIQEAIQFQKVRIGQGKGTADYPFRLIHLGHIYTEAGDGQSARQYYEAGLVSSGYLDNNAIVAPIINWYLRRGQKEAALKICDEILSHNPENSVARSYRDWLISDSLK